MNIVNKVDLSDYAKLTDLTGLSKIASGSYAGSNAANRAIPHGLARTPKLVFIAETGGDRAGFVIVGANELLTWQAMAFAIYAVTTMTDTYFYVGNAADWDYSLNGSGKTYYWTAFG